MLSRRAVLAGGAAALAASPLVARAQTSPPTVLKIAPREIVVNGKSASVYGISQPDGVFGLFTDVGKPFASGSRTASTNRVSSIGTG
jgi:hypothetical protein